MTGSPGGSCPMCGSAAEPFETGPPASGDFDPFHQIEPGGRFFRQDVCPDCGLIFTVPLPESAELERAYAARYNYAWFQSRRFLKKIQARHRWRRVRRFLPERRGTLLDIGAGQGDFVTAARRAGWQAFGIDPVYAADPGSRRGTDVDSPWPPGDFDAITLWHTLEHLRDPAAVLGRAAERLRPGGVLIVAVPNRNASGLETAGRSWGWFQEPFIHLWHFSPKALSALLPAGMARIELSTRDTWDQQTWFATSSYRRITALARALRSPFRTRRHREAGRAPLRVVEPRGAVFGREVIHLAGYAAYALLRGVRGSRRDRELRGSELLLVARRAISGPVV